MAILKKTKIYNCLNLFSVEIHSWVRKLIGKLGVPYNRRLGVRGSSHPLKSCRRFITPRSGKQRFPQPVRLALSRSVYCRVDGLCLNRRDPNGEKFALCVLNPNSWPASFLFHFC